MTEPMYYQPDPQNLRAILEIIAETREIRREPKYAREIERIVRLYLPKEHQ